MLEPEKWRLFLFCCVLISCYGVDRGLSLDAEGCRVLESLCIQSKDCNHEVFFEKCGKYLKGHKTKDRDDPVAIPPESMIDTWLFLHQAYGPKENRNHQKSIGRVSSNPRAKHQSRYVDYEDIRGYRSSQAGQEFESEVNENEADYDTETGTENEVRAVNEANADLQRYTDVSNDDQQAHHKDFKTRSAKQDAQTNNEQNGYYAGQVHHDDASSKILSRLARLAELKEQLDWAEERLNEKRNSDNKYLSRIRKEDFASFYDLSKSYQADTSGKIATGAVNENGNVKTKDDLYIAEEKSLKKSSSEKLDDLDSPKESEIRSEVTIPNKDPSADAKSTDEEKRAFDVAENIKSANLQPSQDKENNVASKDQKTEPVKDTGILILRTSKSVDPNSLKTVGAKLQKVLWGIDASKQKIFSKVSVDPANNKDISLHTQAPSATYSSGFNPSVISQRINSDESLRKNISNATGFTILGAHSRKPRNIHGPPYTLPKDKNWDEFAIIIAIVGGCTLGLIVASVIICSLKRKNRQKSPIELKNKEAITDYEELCRTKMAVNTTSPRTMKAIQADRQRHGLVDGQGKITKKSWREEPLAYNMDITTGHVILSYMEEHLKNENKLSTEWEALCNYKADQDETTASEDSKNTSKNRYSNVLPYDHTRVKLRETANVLHSDYINASYITDVDPRNPAYIATQGPLDNTVADFWQMIWEQGVVVIVNLTRLSDMGLPQCHRYWPEEGSDVYNTYQVHLISEHIWCDDYIVRSFYLKHLLTSETRTVTQFHFLTWPDLSVPESAKPLLEFRRKVNKCYRGQACPIVVHCNNGVGRTGTYILVDMVLKKMIKGTKEIDIAATLEHLRDQRPDMVKTKAQFEFTLAAVAEEVTAILSSLSG